MPLIKCTDCGNDVSDRAPACPKCGAPIMTFSDVKAAGVPLTTTQSTSKKLKSHIMLAIALMVVGALLAYNNAGNNGMGLSASFMLGVLMFASGLAWYIATRVRTWWHHG